MLSIGAGWNEWAGRDDTFQKCMQRADEALYLDKTRQKERGQTTVALK